MSANEGKSKKLRRPRRKFSAEYKAQTVKLALEEGKTIPQVARDLDLTESALRLWWSRRRRTVVRASPAR
ncbi:hypothetical protein D7X30_39960 [Corallococcus sp. AB011P]|uniref:transposase n=1 Tax=Corallococcus sp. AB011P TaxID=2316735 RepID=UPI000EA0E33B|nr:hypothetical protein D7X30_39960 [Corallococcus sp. AB011P]